MFEQNRTLAVVYFVPQSLSAGLLNKSVGRPRTPNAGAKYVTLSAIKENLERGGFCRFLVFVSFLLSAAPHVGNATANTKQIALGSCPESRSRARRWKTFEV